MECKQVNKISIYKNLSGININIMECKPIAHVICK